MKNQWSPTFNNSNYSILKSEQAFCDHFTMYVHDIAHKSFTQEKIRYSRNQVIVKNSVGGILFDPKRDAVVMIEQFRVGAMGHHPSSPWLLEIVAGYVEANEDNETALVREVQEETGANVLSVKPILEYFTSPGGLTEKTQLFCAMVDSQGLGGIHGNDDEQEQIMVHVLDTQTIFEMLDQQWLTSSATVIAVQWLRMHHDHLLNLDYV